MNSTLSSKFKFNQLTWPIYRRFIELLRDKYNNRVLLHLFQEENNFPFSLTNKENYINSVKFRGIKIDYEESYHDEITFNSIWKMEISNDEEFLKNIQKISKFIPYFRIEFLRVYRYNVKKLRLPKTYKKLGFFNTASTANIDHVADVYYHKGIEFIRAAFNPGFTNDELYRAINHAINRMPVKDYLLVRISRHGTHDTVEDLSKVLQIPEIVKSITLKHLNYFPPNFKKADWVIII